MPNTLSTRGFRPLSSRLLTPGHAESVFYPHECALWKPVPPQKLPSGNNPSRLLVEDLHYTLATARQACFYSATPETNSAQVLGRTQNANIFTLDKFTLPLGVDVADTWVIVFLTQGDNYLDTFVVQGEAQAQQAGFLQPAACQLVYGRRVRPRPVGVSLALNGEIL